MMRVAALAVTGAELGQLSALHWLWCAPPCASRGTSTITCTAALCGVRGTAACCCKVVPPSGGALWVRSLGTRLMRSVGSIFDLIRFDLIRCECRVEAVSASLLD